MWIKASGDEARAIGHYLGVLLVGLAFVMAVPFATALLCAEWDAALDYLLSAGVTAFVGVMLMRLHAGGATLTRRQAFVVAGAGWLLSSLFAGLPLALSPNYGSYLDGVFDAMSGLTTSGLTLAVDLDHMANAHNMWRHLTHLIGGQGIIVAAVSLAIGAKGGAVSLFSAEGRDERILPNVMHTARFIWFVTAVWVTLGTAALGLVNLASGMRAGRAFLHALWLTVAAYDTGGFGPQSQNVLFYHSPWVEGVLLILMVAGTFNFAMHADIWRGDRGEVFQNVEARTLALNIAILSGVAGLGLATTPIFGSAGAVLRKGMFHIVSANSGTGHQTFYPGQWAEIGPAAFVAVVFAMGFGGMVGSTAGGIKALRFALVGKSTMASVKKALSPDSAVVRKTFHHIGERRVTTDMLATSAVMIVLYGITYLAGGLIGTAYGYDSSSAMFESVSAAANVGLSTGITVPTMPALLKVTYIVQMWAGRLEFITVFALFAWLIIALAPKRERRWAR